MQDRIEARVTALDDGRIALAAPRVGRFTPHVRLGSAAMPSDVLGSLLVLGRTYSVVLPPDAGGRVDRLPVTARQSPVEYGQVLAELAPIDGAALSGDAPPVADAEADLEEGEELLRSPIEGQFYRRPSPEDPPYVEDDAPLNAGTVLGLVEVMKFFHPVRFERVGDWTLVRFLVDEGSAVDSGAPLAVIRKG